VTYTAEGFNQFCYEAAGKFLQTAVVIDNEAIFCGSKCELAIQEDIPDEIIVPPSGMLGGLHDVTMTNNVEQRIALVPDVETGNTEQNTEEAPDQRKNILKAKPLIDAFAEIGVVCSIIRPELHEEGVAERAISLASVSDIVVVDWALGKTGAETEGSRAKQIIKRIIEGDLKKLGRLRLIAIYTAEGIPGAILDELFEHIKPLCGLNETKKDDVSYTIQNRFLKIVVLLKPVASEHVPGCAPVEFSALPDRLQQLFSELNRGLLPSVTLRAIAAIREGTHHLLAVLHKDLDSALVGHRCLIPHPEDAEEFCEDLVAGEIRSILALAKIGSEFAGKDQNELWIASRLDENGILIYGDLRAKQAEISPLLSGGSEEYKDFCTKLKAEWSTRNKGKGKAPSMPIEDVPQYLYGDAESGKKVNCEFARLTSFKRELFGLRKPPSDWMPKLTLGTILQRVSDNKLFICLQPRCESVRFEDEEASRIFPFLEIGKGKKKGFIVINTVSAVMTADEKELYFDPKPKNQVVFDFKKPERNSVTAQFENNFYVFSDADDNKFYWLGDLKDPLAQNIVGKMSDVVGSVGINPYEWLRLQAK
jgi:Response receiver domain